MMVDKQKIVDLSDSEIEKILSDKLSYMNCDEEEYYDSFKFDKCKDGYTVTMTKKSFNVDL